MIYIEGNIGAGKSTLLRMLATELNTSMAPEPVHRWTAMKHDGQNIIELFYQEPRKYAYLFQSIAFRTRMDILLERNDHHFVERSIHTDRKVFAETCRESGFLNDIEYDDYSSWYEFIIKHMKHKLKEDGYIYLCTSPGVCMQRIDTRQRDGEERISMEYLQNLHEKHHNWLSKEKNVLWLDGNQDFVNDPVVFQGFVTQVKEFFKEEEDAGMEVGWRGC